MKAKNSVKKTVLIFQVFAILSLVLGFVIRLLFSKDYDLLLFGRAVLMELYMPCFLIFYLLEAINVLVVFLKTQKGMIFLTYLVLIPLILLHLYCCLISSSTVYSVEKYNYPEFDTTIVIENGDDLFGPYADFYETKNGFILKKVTYLGENLYLDENSSNSVEIKDNKIVYNYNDGFDDLQLILEYKNGHFTEKYVD